MDFGGGEEIRFERSGHAGIVTMTRPKALNALTHRMVRSLDRALTAWRDDDGVALVIIRGEGRAFCAGGDILHIYEAGRSGAPPVGFFADEYRLNAAIARFPKPYVALIDGIVMGGGVGVSAHGSHRVLTENAVVAMPEVGIGFFPDVGGSHLLPRLKGSYGMYMGLTGNRVRFGDALWSGFATHVVAAAEQDALLGRLCETGDPAEALEPFRKQPEPETPAPQLRSIEDHFSRPTLDEVVRSLEEAAAGDSFAEMTLGTIRARSPTSLRVAFRQIREGARLSMEECMRMEFRIVNRMLAGRDFYEGIRAAVVEKGSSPSWNPATLEAVDEDSVEAYFAPLEGGDLML